MNFSDHFALEISSDQLNVTFKVNVHSWTVCYKNYMLSATGSELALFGIGRGKCNPANGGEIISKSMPKHCKEFGWLDRPNFRLEYVAFGLGHYYLNHYCDNEYSDTPSPVLFLSSCVKVATRIPVHIAKPLAKFIRRVRCD